MTKAVWCALGEQEGGKASTERRVHMRTIGVLTTRPAVTLRGTHPLCPSREPLSNINVADLVRRVFRINNYIINAMLQPNTLQVFPRPSYAVMACHWSISLTYKCFFNYI